MADGLDAAQGFEFLLGATAVGAVGGLQVAVDELDGLEQAAGGLGLPDFAEAAAAQALDQPVAGDGLGSSFRSAPPFTSSLRAVDCLLPSFPKRWGNTLDEPSVHTTPQR